MKNEGKIELIKLGRNVYAVGYQVESIVAKELILYVVFLLRG